MNATSRNAQKPRRQDAARGWVVAGLVAAIMAAVAWNATRPSQDAMAAVAAGFAPTIANTAKPPGPIINDIMAHEDWLPTLLAAVGEPNVKQKLLKGYKAGDKTFKNHLDGYNFMPFFKGEVAEGPRKEFFYFSDNADLMAVRYEAWKLSFKTIKGNLFTGKEDSTNVPLVTNLRQDPWERYQSEGMLYGRWWGEKLWTMVPAVGIVGEFLKTFEEYAPSQRSGSLSVTRFLEAIQSGTAGGGK